MEIITQRDSSCDQLTHHKADYRISFFSRAMIIIHDSSNMNI